MTRCRYMEDEMLTWIGIGAIVVLLGVFVLVRTRRQGV